MMPHDPSALWQHGEQLRRQGQSAHARQCYLRLSDNPDFAAPALLRLSTLDASAGRLAEAADFALRATAFARGDAVLAEALTQHLFHLGEIQAGLRCATDPAIARSEDPRVLLGVAGLLGAQSFTTEALALLRVAEQRGMRGPALDYPLGLSLLYAGQLDAAEHYLLRCVAQAPGHAAAWRALSRLRRQTPERNHVDRLRALTAALPDGDRNAPPLWYALFKECDDLDERDAAWDALAQGLRTRRAQLDWHPDHDRALFAALMNPDNAPRTLAEETDDGAQPIFIVGLPRSGSTLLERILGGSPDVADAGELRDFHCQMRVLCARPGPPHPDAELVIAARRIDPATLGRRYLDHTRWRAQGRRHFTDKLPTNALAAAHIVAALPRARILHIARNPMDAGFSNLKELFAQAYPHSYDQREMAAHLIAHHRLMAHWQARFPDRVLHVAYESLVREPHAQARRILDFCGLPWTDAATAVEARPGAVATASSVQVREPIHHRYIGQWQRYATQLAPLRDALGALAEQVEG